MGCFPSSPRSFCLPSLLPRAYLPPPSTPPHLPSKSSLGFASQSADVASAECRGTDSYYRAQLVKASRLASALRVHRANALLWKSRKQGGGSACRRPTAGGE